MESCIPSAPDVILLPGLVELKTGRAVTFGVNRRSRRLHVGAFAFPDDLLTAVSLTTFGREPFKRLTICRPSTFGLAALARDRLRIRRLVSEFPPQHQIVEFAIDPAADAAWSTYVQERWTRLERLVQDALLGVTVGEHHEDAVVPDPLPIQAAL